jgi:hypothetical protein
LSLRPSNTVRFLRQWRANAPGATSDKLGRGVAELLVQRGIARFDDGAAETPSKKSSRSSRKTA